MINISHKTRSETNLSPDHDIDFAQAELVYAVEDAREGDVLDHLWKGLSDAVLEGFGSPHGGVPLSLQVQKQRTFGRLGTAQSEQSYEHFG